MKKDTIFAIVAVAILILTVFVGAIAVGFIDNPFAPNHFVGSWTRTDEQATMTFRRPMLGRWGTGEIVGFTSFEYKYTDTQLIMRYPPDMTPTIIIFDYSFSSDYLLLILSHPDIDDVTLIRI